MSFEVVNESGSLGQFASNKGFSDLIAASQKDRTLKAFFDAGYSDDGEKISSALMKLKGAPDVVLTARGLAKMIAKEKVVAITNGFGAPDDAVEKAKLRVVHFGCCDDLPESVRGVLPDAVAQELFRGALNSHLGTGATEMHAYLKAYKALEEAGYEYDDASKCYKVIQNSGYPIVSVDESRYSTSATEEEAAIEKDSPSVADVHVDRPMGSDEEEKVVEKEADIISVDVPLFIRLLEVAREEAKDDMALHEITERVTELLGDKKILTMADYDGIVSDLKLKISKIAEKPGEEEVVQSRTHLYKPPAEVLRAAKAARDSGKDVPGITGALADGIGLSAEDVAKVGEFFKNPDEALRDAWGGERAADWSARVEKKIAADVAKYSPEQPRADNGQFGEGNGTASGAKASNPKIGRVSAGDVVVFKPEWQDKGDDKVTFRAIEDEDDRGKLKVEADLGFPINPTSIVTTDMIARRISKKEFAPWIAVDLHDTLVDGRDLSAPKPEMIERVKKMLADGKTVKIFTAWVADDPTGENEKKVKEWCEEHFGRALGVTNEKDPGMTDLWDDKAHGIDEIDAPVEKMIREEHGKFHVYSRTGKKHLGGPYATREEADARLAQIERFKHVHKVGNGVMLSFFLPEDLAKKHAVPGGEKAEDLHVTLTYFGKLGDVGMDDLPALEDAVEAFCKKHAPIALTFSGVGIFPASLQSDGKDVAYLGVHSDKIQDFRKKLVDEVEAAGCVPKKNFGYNPHVSLKMISPQAPHLIASPETTTHVFDEITLSIGGARKTYKLSGEPEQKITFEGEITKVDAARRLVFGWFSIVEVDGRALEDVQGDIIDPETLEETAYDFVLYARTGGEMHENGPDGVVRGVGRLVESVVFTKEKQEAMLKSLKDQGIDAQLDLKCVAWWGGMKIDDPSAWEKVTNGYLRAWSIGGIGKRVAL